MSVYGIGRNEKRDAPYKIGRRSGRKTDATKYEVALRSAADAKWFCETNREYTNRLSPSRNGEEGILFGASPLRGGTPIPTISKQIPR